MKVLTLCVLSALTLGASACAYAAGTDKNVVTRDYTDTVAPAHQVAYDAFALAAKGITAAAIDTKSTVYYRWLSVVAAGDDAPDYVLVLGRKNWADYGALGSPWKMVESVYGKAATDAIRKSVNDSIAKSSSHIDSYNAGLSYIVGK